MLTQYFPPEVGAPQTRLKAVADELVRQGDQVEVVTAMPNYPMGRIAQGYRRRLMKTTVEDSIVVRRVWMYAAMGTGVRRLMSYASFTVTCILGLIRCARADVIFIESPPLFVAVPGILYGKLRRTPVIVNVADMWPDAAFAVGAIPAGRMLRMMYRLEAWAYRHARLVTTVTVGVRTKLIEDKGIEPERVVLLGNGVDTKVFSPDRRDETRRRHLGLPDGDFALYAGTMGLAHGLDPLIDAFAEITADDGIFLVMLGSGSERPRLEQRVAAEGIEHVLFRDPIPVAELAELFPTAAFGVVTAGSLSINKSSRPAKLFPVMSSAIAVLYAGAGEGARIVRDADAGVVVPNEREAIVEGVRRLTASPEMAAALGKNGRAAVQRDWSWGPHVARWRETVIKELRL